ncbi:GntR family transcriptional regulator [Mycolicibacterium obuense]|uniref:GntR family transcriptional regulator n=1 Tax=Mycolicibacterium obuense TaxID=1807 RepID=A0A0M2JZC0_9MYCO|nr:GntR family transcriptional regulator [Mycolicibacterium obuense]KKF02429.1 GntR family transcriptional regulator [Mycolicibacterium obuense]OKH68466.1 GntR family transcriptional regulator [Mycobacterium sp. SWH-M1]TDL07483.1 GntR family transcriptional regulator [Mycolicibacterium obuense]
MSLPKPYVVRTGLDEILAGLSEGDAFPPERELALRFGVARDTVRQAVHELLVEGRIERRGRGTVVSRPKLVQPLSLKSYTEGAQRMGRVPGRLLVSCERVTVDAEITAALDVAPTARVMHLERVLLADGARIGLESSYLPLHRFASLLKTFDPTTSLYAAIRERGVVFGEATERIETVLPTPREAGLLESTTAMPMLLLNRRSVDTDGCPIEVVRALYRGDRVAFEATLTDR